MAMHSLDDLFLHTLKDMYYAERQALKSLRTMARKAASDPLKELLAAHREETEGQVQNLEKVFEGLDKKARGVTCEAIVGITDEGKELMEETADGTVRDTAIIASAQVVEHYEIARYGTLIHLANALGRPEFAKLLQENLDQEIAADHKLSAMAEETLNQMADEAPSEDPEPSELLDEELGELPGKEADDERGSSSNAKDQSRARKRPLAA